MSDFELIENLPFSTGHVDGQRARLGVVVLASDYTLEDEFRQVLSLLNSNTGTVDLFHARIANAPSITPETLAAMGPAITETASRILPGDTLDVLAYGCTSASMVLGPDRVNSLLLAAKPEAKVTNPASAVFAAMNAFGAKRVGVITPYRRDVNEVVRAGLLAGGLDVPVFGSFNEEMDPVVSQIDGESIKVAVRTITTDHQLDAVFISCTSLRLIHIIIEIEAEIGLPVTSSNHAMAWHCLRLADHETEVPQLGRLFALPLER